MVSCRVMADERLSLQASPGRSEAIVAGHICLDIIPALPATGSLADLVPGVLVEVGPVTLGTGGCVSNVGQSLHRLGISTRLVGKVGDDVFGRAVCELLGRASDNLAGGILVAPGELTSYSVILSPPGSDRTFLHYPGANDTFRNEDVPDDVFDSGRLFHFGYPPVMRRMYQDGGASLARLLQRAKHAGLTTALDMAYPDPASDAGKADWRAFLGVVLPFVDVFLPSFEELCIMLYPGAGAEPPVAKTDTDMAGRLANLSGQLLGLGAAIVGIKAGDKGLYLRTGSTERLARAGSAVPRPCERWAERELWSAIFETTVATTVGAGDATVAGFLFGLLRDMCPEDAVTVACAAGASSVEAADAISGVCTWEATSRRLEAGWARRALCPGSGWREATQQGVWHGPGDKTRPNGANEKEGDAR